MNSIKQYAYIRAKDDKQADEQFMTQTHLYYSNTIRIEFTNRESSQNCTRSTFPIAKMSQVHGTRVVRRSTMDLRQDPTCDGQWTTEKGLTLAVKTADCVPLLFYGVSAVERKPSVIGALHCGWRSGLGGILSEFLSSLEPTISGADYSWDIWVGPHIRSCCFQVGKEVVELGHKTLGEAHVSDSRWWNWDHTPGKFKVDLLSHYELQLRKWAKYSKIKIHREFIECTSCLSNKYFSYRKQGKLGSQFSRITLLPHHGPVRN